MSVATSELNGTAASEMLDFVELALQNYESAQGTIADLTNKLAQHEKVTLEKVAAAAASAKAAAIDFSKLDRALAELEQMNILASQDREKVASEIRQHPDQIFTLISKLASLVVALPAEGSEVTPETAILEDRDGWFSTTHQGQKFHVH